MIKHIWNNKVGSQAQQGWCPCNWNGQRALYHVRCSKWKGGNLQNRKSLSETTKFSLESWSSGFAPSPPKQQIIIITIIIILCLKHTHTHKYVFNLETKLYTQKYKNQFFSFSVNKRKIFPQFSKGLGVLCSQQCVPVLKKDHEKMKLFLINLWRKTNNSKPKLDSKVINCTTYNLFCFNRELMEVLIRGTSLVVLEPQL